MYVRMYFSYRLAFFCFSEWEESYKLLAIEDSSKLEDGDGSLDQCKTACEAKDNCVAILYYGTPNKKCSWHDKDEYAVYPTIWDEPKGHHPKGHHHYWLKDRMSE